MTTFVRSVWSGGAETRLIPSPPSLQFRCVAGNPLSPCTGERMTSKVEPCQAHQASSCSCRGAVFVVNVSGTIGPSCGWRKPELQRIARLADDSHVRQEFDHSMQKCRSHRHLPRLRLQTVINPERAR